MVNPNEQERRAHPRLKVNVPLGGTADPKQLTCYLKDISRVGAAAVVNQPLGEMSVVLVEAVLGGGELPKVEISEEAVVVRCDQKGEDQYEVGLFFHTMSSETRDAIDHYIDQAMLLTF